MPNIQEIQARLSQWATDHPEDAYRDLWNLICAPAWLQQAYMHVAKNDGAQTPGVDGMTQRQWAKSLTHQMAQLHHDLHTGTYRPLPCRRVYIPKANGKRRPLGIPAFRDRIVQEAIRMALEPIFEADFLPCSYGFRRDRSTHDAMATVRTYMLNSRRMYFVIEGDIKAYFDTIHHKKLMSLLKRRIRDKRVLDVIWQCLRAGIMEEGIFSATEEGAPQGGGLSPLLANVYLHELDRYFQERFMRRTPQEVQRCRRHGGNNIGYIRYADDFVVLCNGRMEAVRQLKTEIAAFLSDELHLTLSTEKTRITHVNEGFDFLGFRFFRGKDRSGRWKPKTRIPDTKIESVKTKIREKTASNRTYLDAVTVIKHLNDTMRGWGNYYRCIPSPRAFHIVDHYAFWRLVRWFAQKHRCRRREVFKRRYTRTGGDRRLYATWTTSRGQRTIRLIRLTHDIRFHDYRPRKIGNPFLRTPTEG